MTQTTGLTLTSTGGDHYTAVMNNGMQYTVRQEDWSVKSDYYLDTFVHNLPDLIARIRGTGNPLRKTLEMGVARGVLSIGVALLTDGNAQIVGIDIEDSARELVSRNAADNQVSEKIEVRIGNLFEPVREGETFDLIFGELPFIPVDPVLQRRYIADGHASEILNISGGPDGRYLLDILIEQGAALLNPGGALMLIQPSFVGVDKTIALMASQGVAGEVVISKEWRLDDTKFTRNSRGYLETINPSAFSRNGAGDEVFHLTIVVGTKEKSATERAAP